MGLGLQTTVEPQAQHNHPDAISPRPFLKWAGGKHQLLPILRRFCPQHFNVYHESFLGSGVVLFDLVNSGHLKKQPAHLTPILSAVISAYSTNPALLFPTRKNWNLTITLLHRFTITEPETK